MYSISTNRWNYKYVLPVTKAVMPVFCANSVPVVFMYDLCTVIYLRASAASPHEHHAPCICETYAKREVRFITKHNKTMSTYDKFYLFYQNVLPTPLFCVIFLLYLPIIYLFQPELQGWNPLFFIVGVCFAFLRGVVGNEVEICRQTKRMGIKMNIFFCF